MTQPPIQRSSSLAGRPWSKPQGRAVTGRAVADTGRDGVDEKEEEMEMEIDPEMIVMLDELPLPGAMPSATASALVPPSAPVAPAVPRFFNIPIARSSTSLPPPGFARVTARGTSITTPRLSSKRPIAPKGPDSTSIVSPLPPPASPGTHRPVPGASERPARIPRNWLTIGISAVVTGVASATLLLLVSSRHPAVAPSGAMPSQGATGGVVPASLPGAPARAVPPHAAPTAPVKQSAVKPVTRHRPRVAATLDAKLVTPAAKSPATNLHAKPVAPSAKKPALAVARERTAPPSGKAVAPAPKQPARIDPKVVTQTSVKTISRTVRPLSKGATGNGTPAKNKAVANVETRPTATKKKPATR